MYKLCRQMKSRNIVDGERNTQLILSKVPQKGTGRLILECLIFHGEHILTRGYHKQ